jgi:hypothetical protein
MLACFADSQKNYGDKHNILKQARKFLPKNNVRKNETINQFSKGK